MGQKDYLNKKTIRQSLGNNKENGFYRNDLEQEMFIDVSTLTPITGPRLVINLAYMRRDN